MLSQLMIPLAARAQTTPPPGYPFEPVYFTPTGLFSSPNAGFTDMIFCLAIDKPNNTLSLGLVNIQGHCTVAGQGVPYYFKPFSAAKLNAMHGQALSSLYPRSIIADPPVIPFPRYDPMDVASAITNMIRDEMIDDVSESSTSVCDPTSTSNQCEGGGIILDCCVGQPGGGGDSGGGSSGGGGEPGGGQGGVASTTIVESLYIPVGPSQSGGSTTSGWALVTVDVSNELFSTHPPTGSDQFGVCVGSDPTVPFPASHGPLQSCTVGNNSCGSGLSCIPYWDLKLQTGTGGYAVAMAGLPAALPIIAANPVGLVVVVGAVIVVGVIMWANSAPALIQAAVSCVNVCDVVSPAATLLEAVDAMMYSFPPQPVLTAALARELERLVNQLPQCGMCCTVRCNQSFPTNLHAELSCLACCMLGAIPPSPYGVGGELVHVAGCAGGVGNRSGCEILGYCPPIS